MRLRTAIEMLEEVRTTGEHSVKKNGVLVVLRSALRRLESLGEELDDGRPS